jgi:hypothetical protein
MVSNCPAGKASNMLPSAASLRCNDVLISGMRLAQLAKHNPWQKKNTETAMRTCRRGCGDAMAVVLFTNLCKAQS